MKKLLTLKTALFSVALLSGAGASYAASCNIDCDSYARGQRIAYCTQVGGGSACATSEGLYNHFYQQCQQNYCSN